MGVDAEEKVSSFYNSSGWDEADGITEDARRWEDVRPCASDYVSRCRLRIARHIPPSGRYMLDMASGPIQYPEYLQFSSGYDKRFCVDLSKKALDVAKKRIGDRGEFLCGSFFDMAFEPNFFDCSISLHTIYHMDIDRQEEAVRKLLNITRAGQPLIIIYSNPNAMISSFLGKLRKLKSGGRSQDEEALYFELHPLEWWNRFSDDADIDIFPWRSFTARQQRLIFPDNFIGRVMFKLLFWLEDAFPRFFARHFAYPMIVLTKTASHSPS